MMRVCDKVAQVASAFEQAQLTFGQGTLNARDEAAWLVLWAAGLALDTDLNLAPSLDHAQEQRIDAMVMQRVQQRLPLAYLTGEAWLQGVPFDIDARSIVPRSLLAEVLASGWMDDALGDAPSAVMDMCCGNGSLAILAALAWPRAQVLGVDLSHDALALAQRNAQRHQVQDRLTWIHSNVWQSVPRGLLVDLLLCNPPYVADIRMNHLPPEFRAEPDLALRGGSDGMAVIRPFLLRAFEHLVPGGWLVLEIGHERPGFEAAFPQLQPLWLSTSGGEDAVLALQAPLRP